jgi:hypothetical protein
MKIAEGGIHGSIGDGKTWSKVIEKTTKQDNLRPAHTWGK